MSPKKKLLGLIAIFVTAVFSIAAITQVNLATQVMGNLAVSHLNSGTNAGGTTFWRGDGTWAIPAGGGGGGFDPGFAPSDAAGVGNPGLDVTLAAGNAFCSDGTSLSFGGGTVATNNNTTNYIVFAPLTTGCTASALAVNQTGFNSVSGLPIAKVVTAGGAITSLTDYRGIWINQTFALPIYNKGDFITGSGAGNILPRTVGTDGQCLVANSADPTGLSYTSCGSTQPVNGEFTWPSLKGSFVSVARFDAAGGVSSVVLPVWYQGVTPGSCGARSYWPVAGWLRTLTQSTVTALGDGQLSTYYPQVNCTFNGLGASGLTILPSSAAGSYWTTDGTYRLEPLDTLDFAITHKGSTTMGSPPATGGYDSPSLGGMEFLADSQILGGPPVTILGGFGTITPLSNTQNFSGPGFTALAACATESSCALPIPIAGTLQYFVASQTVANGAQPTTLTVRKNFANTSITTTVAAGNGTDRNGKVGAHVDLTHTAAVIAGDYVDWEIDQAAGATGGTYANFMLGFTPASGNTVLIWGSLANHTNQTGGDTFWAPFSNEACIFVCSSELQARYTLPRSGTATKLYLYIGTALAAGKAATITIQKNGADTALTCAATDASVGIVVCDIAHSVVYAQGDGISLKIVPNVNWTPNGGWALAFD